MLSYGGLAHIRTAQLQVMMDTGSVLVRTSSQGPLNEPVEVFTPGPVIKCGFGYNTKASSREVTEGDVPVDFHTLRLPWVLSLIQKIDFDC